MILVQKMRHIIDSLNIEAGSSVDCNKSAIVWTKPTNVLQNNLETDEYWDFEIESPNTEDICKSVSYSQLVGIIKQVMQGLSTIELNAKQQTQPVFAVSIPEGPFLCFAILSINMLNITSKSAKKAPIILPLDPGEGKERLIHMIRDAKPSIILHVRNEDERRLKSAYASVQEKDPHYTTVIVNMKTLINNKALELSYTKELIDDSNRISHIVYTSGTTGRPKGCISSLSALLHYIKVKNDRHFITSKSRVFLASALPFDPCLSDIIATFDANATLCICPRETMKVSLGNTLIVLEATHILCTPSLWNSVESEKRNELGCMEVVALGGEMMSSRIKGWWARRRNNLDGKIKLLSTYGVTEACVYQTVGEIFVESSFQESGQDIGTCFSGLDIRICIEQCDSKTPDKLPPEVEHIGLNGEICIGGKHLDEYSGYLNMAETTKLKFISNSNSSGKVFYRTGDRGYIDPSTRRLHILGRIGGEEGMVKINGVRVELGEIEHSILDSLEGTLVENSIQLVTGCVVTINVTDVDGTKKITAYCVLSKKCLEEIGIKTFPKNVKGIIMPPSPLLTVLRARCTERVRKGTTPSNFIVIDRIPLTRTGKIDRKALPAIKSCVPLHDLFPGVEKSTHLSNYGRCGPFITNELCTCLNLHASQKRMITTSADFALLGGDSLAATRIVRSLYAYHHGLKNNRALGGIYGQLEGTAFNASHLIRAKSLGDYIDFLDFSGVLLNVKIVVNDYEADVAIDSATQLFEALMNAITLNQSTIAVALISEGANPNLKEDGKRLGNTSGRLQQRDSFKANPMHLVCAKADILVIKTLLQIGKCNCQRPDSSGTFPIHLACSGAGDGIGPGRKEYNKEEDKRRLECVRLLLDVGKVPLPMKNSSKQTVLHCAARGGYIILLDYLLNRWKEDTTIKEVHQWGSKCDWQDRWFRTPVHWAVLHNDIDAVRLLLKHGCSPFPPKPKGSSTKRRTSGAIEYPLEICERLYSQNEVGKEIISLLKNSAVS